MADILFPVQPGDSWITDEFGNVTGVSLVSSGVQTKLPRLTNSTVTPTASRQTALVSGVAINSTSIGATTASTGAFTTLSASSTATFSGAVNASPANANVTLSPTGTGSVTINPATAGAINNMSLGQTTPAAVKTSNLAATYTDSTGTPGNVTNNSPRGRVALAAAASTITVTNSLVTAASMIVAMVRATDGAATDIVTANAGAGSFTITMNGATTGTACQIDFLVVN